jgi:hypothetical protein
LLIDPDLTAEDFNDDTQDPCLDDLYFSSNKCVLPLVGSKVPLAVIKPDLGIFVILGYKNIRLPVSVEIANGQVLPV